MASFDALVLPWLDAGYNLARWLVLDDSPAEDAVQEAVVRALRYFEGLRNPEPRPWFVAIVRNTVLPKAVTGHQRTVASPDEAIARLAPDLRELLVLRDVEGLDDAAMAQVLGVPKATVIERHARAIEGLRNILLGSGVGPDTPPEPPFTALALSAWLRGNATRHRASAALLAAVKTQVALHGANREQAGEFDG